MATVASLYKNPSLIKIGISESVSNIGNWITMMAVISIIVFKGGGGVVQSGGIVLAGLVPTLLFSPAAGRLCDRFDRKKLMIASELISGLVVSGLIITSQTVWIYALLAIQAISSSLMTPARQAVMPVLVAREDLIRANAFMQQLAGMVKVGAPILAGFVLSVLQPRQAIILDVISFAASALILSRLPPLPAHKLSGDQPNQPSLSFSRLTKEVPALRYLYSSIFLAILVIVGLDVVAAVYIRDSMGGGAGMLGLVIGMIGLGMLVGTLFLMLRKGVTNPWRNLATGILLQSMIPASLVVAVYAPSGSSRNLVVATGMLMGGIGQGFTHVQIGTLLQTLTPAHLLGRAGGYLQSSAVAGQIIGTLATPLLVPVILSTKYFFLMELTALFVLAAIIGLNTPINRPSTLSLTNQVEFKGGQ